MIDYQKKSIGWRNVDSVFKKRKLYTNLLEDSLNDNLENKIKGLIDTIVSSQSIVQLDSEQMDLLKKYLVCQRVRTIAGSRTLINETDVPYKILDKVCSDKIDKEEYWEDALLEILTKPWKELLSSDNVIVREFCNTEDTMYHFLMNPDEQIMLNDRGFVQEILPNLSQQQQSDVRDYIRKEYGITEYHNLCMYGQTTFEIFALSSDCALVDMPKAWSKIFASKNSDEFKQFGISSPIFDTLIEGNPGYKFPFDYNLKNNRLLVLNGGHESANMINCMTLMQTERYVGLKDPQSMKDFFEKYSQHGLSNSCGWFLQKYDWSKKM